MNRLDIHVRGPARSGRLCPVTGGVPLAQGAAPRDAVFYLEDAQGRVRPLQTRLLQRWPDGSVQWVLLDFQSSGEEDLVLRWRRGARSPRPDRPVRVSRGSRPALRTESGSAEAPVPISAGLDEKGRLLLCGRMEVEWVLTTRTGARCPGVIHSAKWEAAGPVRSALVLTGAFTSSRGERVLGFRMRVSLFAGLDRIRLEPMLLVDADQGMMQKVRCLELILRPRTPLRSGRLGGETRGPSWSGALRSGTAPRLFQRDDQEYEISGGRKKGKRAPGWMAFDDGEGPMAVALADFWQRWPKGLSLSSREAVVELLPRFKADAFQHMEPWYKYQYFFEGTCYQLRTGQTRRWDLWIDFSGDGPSLAEEVGAPLVLAADPAQALATGLWGEIAPAGAPGMAEYDIWAEDRFHEYLQSIEQQRDYGEMNWGDWFGERHINWGNHEYDTSNIILTQFARTGDPQYFYTGNAAARHTSEVDTIHFVNDDLREYFETHFGNPNYPIRPGMMHEHCVGHVGGFYSVEQVRRLLVGFDVGRGVKRPYLCLDPYNLGHVFTQGMARLYFLTGDPWIEETVLAVGDNLAQLILDRAFTGFKGGSHSGRVNGWTMQALAPAYQIAPARRYLRAMKVLADDALSEQDPNCGGWLYELPHGHCFCQTRKHVGEAGFIGCVRMNGLCLYYQLTGDERIPEALKRYIDFLVRDTWDERHSDWRYTSCPATPLIRQIGVTIRAMVHSARITKDEEHIRILGKAWQAKFQRLQREAASGRTVQGQGKTYSLIMYGSAEAATLFAEMQQNSSRSDRKPH